MSMGRIVFAIVILQLAVHAQTGIITTIAGRTPINGAAVRGYDGDGGPAANSTLALANFNNQPCDPNRFEQTSHISVDPQGNLYIADSANNRVRRIDAAGTITTIAGTGEAVSGCQNLPDSPRLFGPSD